MDKEELLIQKRLIELSKAAYNKDVVTFSDFLNLNELNILHNMSKGLLSAKYKLYGGYELAERQMVAFLPDALCYDYLYPFSVVAVKPVNSRYAEELSHRDYLGAIMNLGIERCKMGDILVDDDTAYIFISDKLEVFIIENLTKVRNTMVSCIKCDAGDFHYTPRFEVIKGNVASVRLDSVISAAFPLSRSKVTPLIEGGRVFINGKLVTNNGHPLKENDIISVRKMGRLSFDRVLNTTKKGRLTIQLKKFI